MLEPRGVRRTSAIVSPSEARRLFAEKTDASADLGRAPDAAQRMAEIHARHEAGLARLRAAEDRDTRALEQQESRHPGP